MGFSYACLIIFGRFLTENVDIVQKVDVQREGREHRRTIFKASRMNPL
jgi:hypothetical protein